MGDRVVVVHDATPARVTNTKTTERVVIEESGNQGLPGPPGSPGAPGPPGPSGGNYRHVQGASASVWDIVHNLGFRPNVTAFDSAGTEVDGDVNHIDTNHLTVSFFSAGAPAAFGGEAELS